MIENRDELLNVPYRFRKRREIAIKALESAIISVHPDTVIPEHVKKIGDEIEISGIPVKKRGKIAVFGMGKASYHMGIALHRILGDVIDEGVIVSIKEGKVGNIVFKRGSHPFPDEETLKNTEKILDMAKSLREGDLAIVLISGGGSSMFCMPKYGVSLEEIREITESLMKKGADIWELNVVRRSLSMVKGGKFTRYLRPAKVISLIISDVVDNHLPSIASGPTVAVKNEERKAEEILRRYGIWDQVSEGVKRALKEEIRGESADMNLIIADNRMAVSHASMVLALNGIEHQIYHSVIGSVEEISKAMVNQNLSAIMGGESTAKVRGNGRGGRNQELVLRAMKTGSKGLVASVGTDGIDGNSPYAGAIADEYTAEISNKKGLDMEEFLKNSDSSSFFERVGGAIKTGFTGTNVADIILHIV